jgi:hypothetical protein
VTLLGLAVLLGWRGDLGVLHHALERGPAIRPVTGACLIALSCALAAGRMIKTRRLGGTGRWLWAAACAGTLAFAIALLLQLFVFARVTSRPASPHTVLSMALIALAIAASFRHDAAWRQRSVLLALAGAAIAWIALLGYATSVPFFYSLPDNPEVGMSVVSAPALLLLALGVLGLWPEHGFVALLFARTTGGQLMRTLLPAAAIFPIVTGALLNIGWFSQHAVLAITLGATSIVVIALVLAMGVVLKRHDALHTGFVTMCAWTRRVLDDGKWVEFEEFLEKRLKVGVTHGISADAANELLDAFERGEDPDPDPSDTFFDVKSR